MVHSIKQGKTERQSYSQINEVIDVPNLIEIQSNSYRRFLDEGIQEVFDEVSPITDSQGIYEIYFLEKVFDPDSPINPTDAADRKSSTKTDTSNLSKAYLIDQCKKNDSNYAAPLFVKIRLRNKDDGTIKDEMAYITDFPIMNSTGRNSWFRS